MPLDPGTRLGPYVVEALIGAGGMGEVYKARDTRLNRPVAIKILPDGFASSPELRERFEREARLVAGLSHPHICVLHDVGADPQSAYLVMEYLDGETLAARLRRGPLPIADALRIGAEIGEALAHAHRHGIVHRDLKPGNVMLTRTGAKLLDFGLAKTTATPVAVDGLLATAVAPLTERGSILGTVRYMAPEQIEGRETDERTDVFTFGVLLYELVTGAPPFKGDSHAAIMGAILKDTPAEPRSLAPLAPSALDHLLARCLAKDPDARWQSIADVAAELRWLLTSNQATASAPRRTGPSRTFALLAAGAAIGVAAMLFLPRLSSNGQPAATALFPIAGPADTAVQSVQIAPDGRRIVFAAAALGRPSTLWTSSTGGVAPKALEGTEGANLPFWSPDSQAIGFFADGKLKRVPADGGPVTVLCAAPFARGAVWSEHSIVFSAALSMLVVSDGGGKPEAVPGIPPGSVRWPTMLPDRRHFVYFENKSRTDLGALFVASLDGGAPRQIGSDAQRAIYVAPGFLVYGRGTALLAQRFDLGTLRLAGEPTPIATDLWYDLTALGLVDVSTSADGATLMYRTGGEERTQLTWYTRDGRAVGTLGEPATDMNVQLSPDSSRVLLSRADSRNGHRAIWLMDQRDGTRTRLSLGPADDDLDPVWSPDASELAFTSTREAHTALYRRPVSGGEPQRITADLKARFPRSWSEDGKYLIVDTLRADGSVGTEVLSLRDGASTSLEPLSIEGWFGQFSHDGKWIAYSANTSGRFEIYVQPFPLTGAKWQISTGGGLEPRWRRDGSELYFISPDQHLLAVPVNGAGGVMHASVAQTLFPIRITRADRPDTLNHYDVTPDGQRFLLAAQPARSGPIAAALISWQSLLTSR